MPLTMEPAGGEYILDRRGQRVIRHRAERSAPLRRRRHRLVAINARASEPPHAADQGQAIRLAGDRRNDAAHDLRLRRTKGRSLSSPQAFCISMEERGDRRSRGRADCGQVPRRTRLISSTSTPYTSATWRAVIPYLTKVRMRAMCDLAIFGFMSCCLGLIGVFTTSSLSGTGGTIYNPRCFSPGTQTTYVVIRHESS